MATNRATRYPGRWGAASADYPMGVPKNRTSDTAKDGSYFEKDWISDYEAFFGAILTNAGESPNGTVDTATSSQIYSAHIAKVEEIATEKSLERVIEASPLNNDWNGYLDPAHTTPIEYVDTSTGTRSFAADTEIAPNLYVSAASDVTFSATGISWLLGNSLYKLYNFTEEQLSLIDETTVPVFIKDESGVSHNLTDTSSGVNVTKPDATTLKVEIDFTIFTTLGITKLWRFFPTEKVGHVGELSVDESLSLFINKKGDPRKFVDVTLSRSRGVSYLNDTHFPKYINIDYFMSASQSIPYFVDSYEFNIRSPAGVSMAANLNVKLMPGESFMLSAVGTMTIYKWSERGM